MKTQTQVRWSGQDKPEQPQKQQIPLADAIYSATAMHQTPLGALHAISNPPNRPAVRITPILQIRNLSLEKIHAHLHVTWEEKKADTKSEENAYI